MSSTQTFNGQLYSKDIYPLADVQYNLGSTGSRWHSLYVGTGSVYIGTTKIGSEAGSIVVNGGITAGGIQIGNSTSSTNMYQFIYNQYGEQEYLFTPYSNTVNGVQTFIPPKGTTSLEVECWGAGGGDDISGGYGGYSYSSFTGLKEEMHLKLWVGDVGEGGKTYYDNSYYDYNVIYQYNGTTPSIGVFSESGVYYIASVVNEVLGTNAGNIWAELYNGTSNLYVSSDSTNPNWNFDMTMYINNEFKWNDSNVVYEIPSFTGTILFTGTESILNSTKYLKVYNTAGDFIGVQIVQPSNNTQNKKVTDTKTSGGGASFVYLNTGTVGQVNSYYKLTNVGGGGGGGSNLSGFRPSHALYSYLGGNSETKSNIINASSFIGSTIYINPVGNEIELALQGQYNTGGTGGYSTIGNRIFDISTGTKGGSGMPLITSSVSSNLSSIGGDGTFINIKQGFTFFEDYSVAGAARRYYYWNVCGGGGGRGFGGGGGGGILYVNGYVYNYDEVMSPVDPYRNTVDLRFAFGTVFGGAGGGNYSLTGYTYSIGYGTGSLIGTTRQASNRKTSGLVRIVCKGLINPTITTSPSGTSSSSTLQTSGMSITNSGDTLFSSNVNIKKDVEIDGISTFNQNLNIPNFQNIFKSSKFDPKLYSIFSNGYNYSTQENTVDLNYALAAMSLEMGYVQNALSGLVQLLAYKDGTYNDNGELTDIPQYVKLWLRNYFPETTASLINYVSALETSIYPTLEYLYSNNLIIPFGYFSYIYATQVQNYLFGIGIIGFYVENNKYYIFPGETSRFLYPWMYFPSYLQTYAYHYLTYLLSPYNENISIQTFVELNSPSGSYKMNIPLDIYQNFCTVRGVTFDDKLVYYINYNSSPQSNIQNLGDYLTYANSRYIDDYWYIMYTTTDYLLGTWGNRRTYYNMDIQYTGTYSSGTFIRKDNTVIPCNYTPPLALASFTSSLDTYETLIQNIQNTNTGTQSTGSFTLIKKELNPKQLYDFMSQFSAVTSKTVKNTVVAAASKPATTTTSTTNVANTLFKSPVAPVSLTVPRTTPATPATSTVKTAVQPRP